MQVIGNGKGVVTACVAVAVFRNPVTPWGAAGYTTTLGGVLWYSLEKRAVRAPVVPWGDEEAGEMVGLTASSPNSANLLQQKL